MSDFFLQMFFFTTVLSIDIRRMEVRTGWGHGLVPWLLLLCERAGAEGSVPWDLHPLKKKKGVSCKNVLGHACRDGGPSGTWKRRLWVRGLGGDVVNNVVGRRCGEKHGWKETG